MKKKYQKRFVPYAVVAGVFLLIMIGYFWYQKSRENYNYLKIDSSKYFVYTISQTQNGHYYQYQPYLNLKGDLGRVINQDIDSYVQRFNKEDVCITYDYDVSGNLLSLVIKVEDYGYAESAAILSFRTYNIHLKRLELIGDEELFSYYGIQSSDVESLLNQQLRLYYQDLQSKGDLSKSCDYACFLEARNIDEGMKDTSFYVREGKLVAYKPYTFIQTEASPEIVYDFVLTN